ncbi:FAD synthetase, putative [Talaromyces stipitatus ATCC 10500]|uniref:FAD synthase n=1 Tax=Talaromyces stipitatus (strain ATCC 10500 / CBS 375.48 / QM 6759 / NRRL 1006) TaxID=441959 RepID=B8MAB8_TALSN|nr:FAD synthetase, putative [Talaromyces stipitatus ATCC 10500]EED18620.1 FAD synthetase, putative [Talaromyces stipitatus ATCC 10500]
MNQDSSFAQDGSPVNGATKNPSASNVPRTLEEVAIELRTKVFDLLELQTNDELLQNLQKQIRISIEVIEESFRRYRPEELSLSYNGGKDCLVLLVLILVCLPSSTSTFSKFPERLQSIFIIPYDSFPEVEEFVATSTREYFLDLTRYVLPMRPALELYLKERPNIKAIWIGTRRVDPNGGQLTHFDYTDKGWPQFMRIHPVIDWHYAEIWAFIRHLGLDYCPLYDRGFTSLGGVSDTQPNPALAVANDPTQFRPAYELKEDNEERLGRDR